jgi:hypothetical protein
MSKLTSIADLSRPQEELAPLIDAATKLSSMYFEHVATRDESYTYEVDIKGGGTRAAGIHASEVSNCLRQLVYAVAGTERKPTGSATNMLMRFNIGHAVHALIQNDFRQMYKKSGIYFEDELSIHPGLGGAAEEWNIHSSCDGVFTWFEDRTVIMRMGLEIKTASPGEFEKLREPKQMHLEQAHVYMACLDLPMMWFLYYNKGNSNITTSYPPFLVKFNPALWEQLEIRFTKAIHLAETNREPARDEGMYCSWCPFSWACEPEIVKRSKQQHSKHNIPAAMRPNR